ncbi:MAG: hypothetical protein FJX72_18250, partial [Armatimonadetes bacterium]|nr:hypothetical protein [Armatimonadota bacterium]
MRWLTRFGNGTEARAAGPAPRRQVRLRIALLACLVMGGSGADATVWPKGKQPAPIVDVVDVSSASYSMRLTLTMLQGLVNRGPRAQAYLLQPGPSDAFWLEHLKQRGDIKQTRTLTPTEFLERHASRYRKVFVYDPAMSASINAAIMLGSLEGGLACAPGDAETLAGGRPVEDLRGRWKTNAEAIDWCRQTLRPRMKRDMLASMNPKGGEPHLYDYLVAHKVFTFWITSEEKADGKVSIHAAERTAVEKVLAEAPVNTPVLGFWFSGPDHGINEYTGVGLAGETGQYTVVTSHSSNLSLLCGVKVNWQAAVRRYRATLAKREAPKLERDKIYVCFEFTESGDSPFYLQYCQWKEWQDPMRGKLPFNWNVGPMVLELCPVIMEYFYDQATPNDFFYVSLSGAGYNHPYRDLFSRVSDPEAAWKGYVALTRRYMKLMGLLDLQLYTDAWKPYDRAKMDPITLRFIEGIPELRSVVLGMGRDGELTGDNGNYRLGKREVLVSHCLTRWDQDYGKMTKQQNIEWP